MQQVGYYHINSLAQKIQEQLQEKDSHMIALLQIILSLTVFSTSLSEEDYQD